MGVVLSVTGLGFSYGRSPVLEDVGFELRGGSVACLVGPNGVGKSTLLKCICRILNPVRGTVSIDSRDVAGMKRSECARIMSYVPQTATVGFPHTVFEEVLIGRRPYVGWRVTRRDTTIVSETLVSMGLGALSGRYHDELSGGERQKVTIARALAQEPQLVVLDEPTSNLDVRRQLEVMGMLQELAAERDILVLVAMHDLNLAARYSDVVLVMSGRTLVAVGPPEAVLTVEQIERTYGVRASVRRDETGRLSILPIAPAPTRVEEAV